MGGLICRAIVLTCGLQEYVFEASSQSRYRWYEEMVRIQFESTLAEVERNLPIVVGFLKRQDTLHG